jgi:hypothetical protein
LEYPGFFLGLRASTQRSVEHRNQIVTRPEGCLGPTLDDSARQRPRTGFFSIFMEDPRENLLRLGIQKISGGWSIGSRGIHAHVQLDPGPERKPATIGIELVRTHTQIEKDTGERLRQVSRRKCFVESSVDESHPISKRGQRGFRGLQGIGVAIYREYSAARALLQ